MTLRGVMLRARPPPDCMLLLPQLLLSLPQAHSLHVDWHKLSLACVCPC